MLLNGQTLEDVLSAWDISPKRFFLLPYVPTLVTIRAGYWQVVLPLTVEQQVELANEDLVVVRLLDWGDYRDKTTYDYVNVALALGREQD